MTSRIKFYTPTAATWLATALVTLMVTPRPASAQTPAPAPATAPAQAVLLDSPEFARLIKGKKVVVTTSDGKERKGDFELAPAGLVMKPRWEHGVKLESLAVPLNQIVRVTQGSRHRGMKLGIGLGFAAGAVPTFAFLLTCLGDECESLAPVLIGGAIGAGVGGALGAMFDSRNRDKHVIYEKKPGTTTMSFAPIVSRTRKGAAFSITWR